jgi:hypothetical protein
MRVSFRSFTVVLVGMLLLTGCRTYGDEGYESESKIYAALRDGVQQMEQDLGRAQSDLRRLESAAESVDTLKALAARYQALISSHEAVLHKHKEQAEQLSGESAYRSLHRVYGALITDRQLLQDQYERTTRKVWATVQDTTVPRVPVRLRSTYNITPVQYPGYSQPSISMAEALQGLEETPGLLQEEQANED